VFEINVSAADVAVTVTAESLIGGVLGAVYVVTAPLAVDLGDSEPQGGVGHDSVQVTPLFAESLDTVALICCVPLACIVADAGETATLMGGGGAEGLLPQPTMPIVKAATKKICGNDTRWKDMTDLHVLVLPAFSFPNWKRQRGAAKHSPLPESPQSGSSYSPRLLFKFVLLNPGVVTDTRDARSCAPYRTCFPEIYCIGNN